LAGRCSGKMMVSKTWQVRDGQMSLARNLVYVP
jgi:hypothetical protein